MSETPDTPSTEALTPDVHDLATAIYVSRFDTMTLAQAEDLADDIFTVFQEAAVRQEAADTSGLREAAIDLAYALDSVQLPDKAARAATRLDELLAQGATKRPLDVDDLTAWPGYERHQHADGSWCMHKVASPTTTTPETEG